MRKNNRERILETARALLPKHGYSGISIRAIAARARLTTGAIYFHFKSKKEIYRTICLEAVDILIEKFRAGMDGRTTPNEKLISTFDSYMGFFNDHREHYNILMEYKAEYNSGDEGARAVARKMDGMMDLIEEVIRTGKETGNFRDVDPMMLAMLLASIAEGMLQFKKLGMFDYKQVSDRDFRMFMADVIGRGIIKGAER